MIFVYQLSHSFLRNQFFLNAQYVLGFLISYFLYYTVLAFAAEFEIMFIFSPLYAKILEIHLFQF
jgi:hypothetical protein